MLFALGIVSACGAGSSHLLLLEREARSSRKGSRRRGAREERSRRIAFLEPSTSDRSRSGRPQGHLAPRTRDLLALFAGESSADCWYSSFLFVPMLPNARVVTAPQRRSRAYIVPLVVAASRAARVSCQGPRREGKERDPR